MDSVAERVERRNAAVTKRVLLIVAVWLCLAVIVSASGLLAAGPARLPQAVLLALTTVLMIVSLRSLALRAWLYSIDIRAFPVFNLSRFAGAYFLVLYQRGELPYDFAVKGGWGDILVATLAMIALAVPKRAVLLAWNTLGLIDILFVVDTAARLAFTEPGSMQALARLPLALLPTFLVPLIISSHVWLFLRLPRR